MIVLSNSDIEKLASLYDINGRQIKNAIRMAQCLAKDNKEEVSLLHIENVLRYI
jgi:hypothetical protein